MPHPKNKEEYVKNRKTNKEIEKENKRICDIYEYKKSLREIGEELDISRNVVYYRVRHYEQLSKIAKAISMENRELSENEVKVWKNWERIVAMYQEGVTYPCLSSMLDVPKNNLHYFIHNRLLKPIKKRKIL